MTIPRLALKKLLAVVNPIAVVAVTVLLAIAGCSGDTADKTSAHPSYPMILFAVDGLEWNVMNPLLEQGRLPVMAGLMERGTYGYLATMKPTYSPVIWTSIATGKFPPDHGIAGYVYNTRSRKTAAPNGATTPAGTEKLKLYGTF